MTKECSVKVPQDSAVSLQYTVVCGQLDHRRLDPFFSICSVCQIDLLASAIRYHISQSKGGAQYPVLMVRKSPSYSFSTYSFAVCLIKISLRLRTGKFAWRIGVLKLVPPSTTRLEHCFTSHPQFSVTMVRNPDLYKHSYEQESSYCVQYTTSTVPWPAADLPHGSLLRIHLDHNKFMPRSS